MALVRSLRQAFFGRSEKNSRRKKLKTQGKNSKLKPKAQKVGTFLNFLTFLCEKLQVL